MWCEGKRDFEFSQPNWRAVKFANSNGSRCYVNTRLARLVNDEIRMVLMIPATIHDDEFKRQSAPRS